MSKVWFLTGASSGIGTGVIRAALEAGDRVVAGQGAYPHNQSGEAAKLGNALVQLAVVESPPKQFFVGSDTVSGITADLQARLAGV